MNASAVLQSVSSAAGALSASDSSWSAAPSQYNGVTASGGVGPASQVHVLWDLGVSAAVSRVIAYTANTASVFSSVDGVTWTSIGTVGSSGTTVTGSARYIQFASSGTGSQIYETQLQDGSSALIAPPGAPPGAPAAPAIGTATMSSISVVLPALPATASSLSLWRAVDSGSGLGSYTTVASSISTGGSTYLDTAVVSGSVYYYACTALNAGGASIQGTSTTGTRTTNFTISVSPNVLSVQQGLSVSASLIITPVNGFAGTVGNFASTTPGTGLAATFAASTISFTNNTPQSVVFTVQATASPETTALTISAAGNDSGTPVGRTTLVPITVTAPVVPAAPASAVFDQITQTTVLAFLSDLPSGTTSLALQYSTGAGLMSAIPNLAANSKVLVTGLTAGTVYTFQVVGSGAGGSTSSVTSNVKTLSLAATVEVPWAPILNSNAAFGPRVPTGAVGLAFLDIPLPSPEKAAGILDLSQAVQSNSTSRKVSFNISPAPLTLARTSSGTKADLGGSQSVLSTGTQVAASSPVKILSIEEDPSGGWRPVVSRGVFYSSFTLSDDPRSWLYQAGLRPGQKVIAAYSTEKDYRSLSLSTSGFTGGGCLAHVLQRTTPNSSQVAIGTQIAMVGGLRTSSGTELLASASGAGAMDSLSYAAYAGSGSTGRTYSGTPLISGTQTFTQMQGGVTFSSLTTLSNSSVVVFSGGLNAQADGFYTLTFTGQTNLRCSIWGCTVLDTWYGAPQNTVSRTVYLHKGWHAFEIDAAPSDNASIAINFGGLTLSSLSPAMSHVSAINLETGMLTLRGNWQEDLLVSFLAPSQYPLRGYYGDLGVWHGLDLNPRAGRTYDNGKSTSDWLTQTCFVYLVPTLVLALTDVNGNLIPNPVWISAESYTHSCVRWGAAPATYSANSLNTTSILGSGSSTIYSASAKVQGINDYPDPRNGYKSGILIGAVVITNGLPTSKDVKIHDVRQRGGGIASSIRPETLSGAQQMRAATHWDLSSWDGLDSFAGKVIVQVPKEYVTGSDGMPAWTMLEIEALVQESVSAGIEAVVQLT